MNGQREITLSFFSNQINEDFIDKIEFGWKLLFKGEWYTIIAPAYQLDGDKTSMSVDAVLSFFVDLNGHYLQDEVENKSFTPASFFSDLFTGTGYSFVLVDNLGANTLNYQRNQSKTERFLYAIDRFKGEYTIKGKVAYIYSLAGSDKDIILHDDLNIQDARVEVDASGFHTYAKGYGDLDESKEDADYELETEYESPLIAKYGKIEGPALYDGSFKHEPALHEAVKQRVENSYSISTTITPVDLTNNGYPEMQLEEGDRVYLHIDRLDLNQQVRVIEIEESFDVEGNIIDVQYTLGNESIAKRYKTQQYSTLKDFQDIINGNKKIEITWLDEAIKRASDIINGNLDSHFNYGPGEIIGINRSNPNGYMRFNTDGIGFSRDGGKTYRTAITYEGIVADAIAVGTLRGILIDGVEIIGGIIRQEKDGHKLELENGEIRSFRNGNLAMKWGGWAQEFYNTDGTLIGSIAPTRFVDDDYYGLGIDVEHDYLSIGHVRSGLRRPVLRTHDLNGRRGTTIAGMFDGREVSERDTELFLGANSQLAIPTQNDDISRLRQAALLLRNRPKDENGNSATLYVGGYNNFSRSQHFEVRANTSSNNSERIAYFAREAVRFQAAYDVESTFTTNILRVNEIGELQNTSSSRRFKLDEKVIGLDYARRILNLNAKKWDDKKTFIETGKIVKAAGLIAEDTHDAGLELFVSYDKEGKPHGLSANLWVLMLPIIKDFEARIKVLEELK